MPALVRGFVILDIRLSRDHPIGDAVETFIRREDAEASSRRFAAAIPSSHLTCESRSASSRRVG
jgi:hypothetical protein